MDTGQDKNEWGESQNIEHITHDGWFWVYSDERLRSMVEYQRW